MRAKEISSEEQCLLKMEATLGNLLLFNHNMSSCLWFGRVYIEPHKAQLILSRLNRLVAGQEVEEWVIKEVCRGS